MAMFLKSEPKREDVSIHFQIKSQRRKVGHKILVCPFVAMNLLSPTQVSQINSREVRGNALKLISHQVSLKPEQRSVRHGSKDFSIPISTHEPPFGLRYSECANVEQLGRRFGAGLEQDQRGAACFRNELLL